MEILTSYLDYRKNKPLYKPWRKSQEDKEAKRLVYIEKNGIGEEQKTQDIKRAKAVLDAIDIMDEYSQSRAEDTELITQSLVQQLTSTATQVSMLAGFAIFNIKPIKNGLGKIAKKFKIEPSAFTFASAMGLAYVVGFVSSVFGNAWGTKNQIEASRIGRHEAMNKELSNVNHFAVLTNEQQEEVNKIAKTIEIDKKEKKKAVAQIGGFKNLVKAFKDLMIKNEEFEKSKAEFSKKISQDEAKFDTVQLSEKQLEEAKKDKQLITNAVEKIDIASQDYAENIELATDVVTALALGGGGTSGLLTNVIINKTGLKNSSFGKIAPFAVGLAVVTAISLLNVKLQKQGSRVARYKVKQDFLKHPEKLFYVDDEKANNENGEKFKQESKNVNIFKFLFQAIKDNREYEKYLKENNVEIKQKRAALEKIKITPEQEKRAKQLQMNVFKTFNKVDEKSQKYSKSTEMLGETLRGLIGLISVGSLGVLTEKSFKSTNEKYFAFSLIKWAVAFLGQTLLLNAYVTKEQKNASRVADMLALKDLEDIRHFADYSENKETSEIPKTSTSYDMSKYIKR